MVSAFIDKVVVELNNGELHVVIYWQDRKTSELMLASSGETFTRWLKQDTERLFALIEGNTAQVEIASAFPDRTWNMIRQKVWLERGTWFKISPKPILDYETYADYCKRVGEHHKAHIANVGEKWTTQQIQTLTELLGANATQVELASQFPFRRWEALRRKITSVRGVKYQVEGPREIAAQETFFMYQEHTQQNALVSCANEGLLEARRSDP